MKYSPGKEMTSLFAGSLGRVGDLRGEADTAACCLLLGKSVDRPLCPRRSKGLVELQARREKRASSR